MRIAGGLSEKKTMLDNKVFVRASLRDMSINNLPVITIVPCMGNVGIQKSLDGLRSVLIREQLGSRTKLSKVLNFGALFSL